MRVENARLGVETTMRNDLTARSATKPRSRSFNGQGLSARPDRCRLEKVRQPGPRMGSSSRGDGLYSFLGELAGLRPQLKQLTNHLVRRGKFSCDTRHRNFARSLVEFSEHLINRRITFGCAQADRSRKRAEISPTQLVVFSVELEGHTITLQSREDAGR